MEFYGEGIFVLDDTTNVHGQNIGTSMGYMTGENGASQSDRDIYGSGIR